METKALRRLVLNYQENNESLKDLLLNIQKENKVLSEREVYILFKLYDIPLAMIEACVKENDELEIVEYQQKLIQVCNGSACSYKRSQKIMDFIAEQKDYEVQYIECLGQCSSGPIALVNGETYIDINQNFGFKMAFKK